MKNLKKHMLLLIIFCASTTNATTYKPGDFYVTPWSVWNTDTYSPASNLTDVVTGYTGSPSGTYSHTVVETRGSNTESGLYKNTTAFTIYVCSFDSANSTYTWRGKTIPYGQRFYTKHFAWLQAQPVESTTPTCAAPVNPCLSKQDQDSDPILVGLPYNAQYYQTVGVCDNGCVQKPTGPVIVDQYANDGSGWAVGPWSFTGQQCTSGVTPEKPTQPPPEDQCTALRNACEAKCQGKAYVFDCNTGGCECFGSGGYTEDPPKNPTTPTTDPGSPTVPSPTTPTTDPGVGGNQLGAQISNQGKQINQGDAQLGQLGAINGKLGAVISNQGKQIGQADTQIDYARRQLGVTEEIRNTLEKWDNSENPGLPTVPEHDTEIPDTKNWTEHDDPAAVGAARANREIQKFGSLEPSPLNFNVTANGSAPTLSGMMFGKQIEIRFDRPWMETGYAIMHALFIGIGYLQVFLMVHKVMTGGN